MLYASHLVFFRCCTSCKQQRHFLANEGQHEAGRPLSARDDGGGQPVHVHREVVNLSQKRIGRNRAGAQHSQQVLGLRLDQDAGEQGNERLVLRGGFPARLCRAGFDGDDFVQHVLPGARRHHRVAVPEIDAG